MRCRGHLDQDRAHGRTYLDRTGIEELPTRYRLLCDIVLMTTKERNVVRIVR
jgi:hypothetical protein